MAAGSRRKTSGSRRTGAAPPADDVLVGRVSRELRATAKRTPAVKGWLRDLEEPVRRFVVDRGVAADPDGEEEERGRRDNRDEVVDVSGGDSDDEEIVFVGRKKMIEQQHGERARRRVPKRDDHSLREGGAEPVMVLDSPGDDESSAFKYVEPFLRPYPFHPFILLPSADF